MKAVQLPVAEKDIINGLKSRDERTQDQAIRKLYTETWMNMARNALRTVGGNELDLEDVFQESLVALVKNVISGRFRGDSKLSTYFYSICRRKGMNRNKNEEHTELLEPMIKGVMPSLEDVIIDQERKGELKHLMAYLFKQLGEPCGSILKFRSQNYSHEEISEKLNYDNPDSVKNQAGRCRKRLRTLISTNPELINKIKVLR